ncbi:PilZ domain-containing protein [Tianweitania populi]|nr:PilZ domain-containing protein [Tianweitania populi]
MSDPSEQKERALHRQRVLKGGAILHGTQSEIRCTIRNMHSNGAELRVPADIAVPKSFLLYVSVDNIAYQCELRWRTGDRAGVEITGTAPKPHWHYG